ncbi:hypothetical protein P615_08230 [Brevibacillus laterosporus PE36]|nr:hypothetical protein P615_08230 [Brevibacillus laterosporus PE36]
MFHPLKAPQQNVREQFLITFFSRSFMHIQYIQNQAEGCYLKNKENMLLCCKVVKGGVYVYLRLMQKLTIFIIVFFAVIILVGLLLPKGAIITQIIMTVILFMLVAYLFYYKRKKAR